MSDYTPRADPMWEIRHFWATSNPGDYVQNAAWFDQRRAEHDETVRAAERERIARDIEARKAQEEQTPFTLESAGVVDGLIYAARIAREGA